MKLILTALLALFSLSALTQDYQIGTWSNTPNSLILKVYAAYASDNTQCTNLQQIFSNPEGEDMDFTNNPVLGSGQLAIGNYPCIVIEFGNIITYTPTENGPNGNCTGGAEMTLSVCQTGSSTTLADGTVSNCNDSSNMKVAMYLTTQSSDADDNDAFNPPTSANDPGKGMRLGSPFVVSSEGSGTFKVNASNKIVEYYYSDTGAVCEMGPPDFSFE